jgi:putative tryptophan/tyrosine transport system substrate-binding protein
MLAPRPLNESFYAPGILRRLAELGYRESTGMVLEYRSSDGFADRYPKLARELIDLKCDVIFAIGAELSVRALQAARAPMPVVFLAIEYEPLEKGIIKSLARPEGNMTGLYLPQNQMGAKRLQIMHEALPAARRFLVFADATSKGQLVAIRDAAEAAGLQLTVVEFSGLPYDFAGAFEAGKKAKVEGFVGLSSGVFAAGEKPIAALLLKHRLPGIGSTLRMSDAGYLLGFNADVIKVTRRVAEISARILKGAKPADIPVEQADEFELAINAKTARALGIKIPESVLARATRIVQ